MKHTIETHCRLLHPSGKKVVGVILVDGKPTFQTEPMDSVEEILQTTRSICESLETLEGAWIRSGRQAKDQQP